MDTCSVAQLPPWVAHRNVVLVRTIVRPSSLSMQDCRTRVVAPAAVAAVGEIPATGHDPVSWASVRSKGRVHVVPPVNCEQSTCGKQYVRPGASREPVSSVVRLW